MDAKQRFFRYIDNITKETKKEFLNCSKTSLHREFFKTYTDKQIKGFNWFNIIILGSGHSTRMSLNRRPKLLLTVYKYEKEDFEESLIHNYVSRLNYYCYKKLIISCSYRSNEVMQQVERLSPLQDDLPFSYYQHSLGNIVMVKEHPDDVINNAVSLKKCLEHAIDDIPTFVMFGDFFYPRFEIFDYPYDMYDTYVHPFTTTRKRQSYTYDNSIKDRLFVVSNKTKGVLGTYRHFYDYSEKKIIKNNHPLEVFMDSDYGFTGTFFAKDTVKLKQIVNTSQQLNDMTDDVVIPYFSTSKDYEVHKFKKIYHLGTNDDYDKFLKLENVGK